MSKSIGTIKVGFNVNTSQLQGGLNKAAGAFRRFGSSMTTLGLTLGVAITAPLVMIGKEAVKLAAELEKSYVKVKNLAGVGQKDLSQIKSGIAGLSEKLGVSQIELVGAAYAAASSGIRDAATNLKIVEIAGKGAIQGFGNAQQIAKSIAAVINVYGKENINAARAGEILFNTVKEGEIEIDALAKTIGRVLAPAKTLGISFEEVGANLATYTRAGVNAEEAITGLRNVMSGVASPSAEFAKAMKNAGSSVTQLRSDIKEKGLARALVDLSKKISGSGQNIEDLFGNIRGLVNVLSVAGEQSETYIEIVDNLYKEFGNLERGASDMGDTLAQKMEKARVAVENAKIELGYALAPVVVSVSEVVKGLANRFSQLSDAQKESYAQIAILAAATPLLIAGIGQIQKAVGTVMIVVKSLFRLGFTTNAIIASIAVGGVLVWTYWDDVKTAVKEALDGIKEYIGEQEWLNNLLAKMSPKNMFNSTVESFKGLFALTGGMQDYTEWLVKGMDDPELERRWKRKFKDLQKAWFDGKVDPTAAQGLGEVITQVVDDVSNKVKDIDIVKTLQNLFKALSGGLDEFLGKYRAALGEINGSIQESQGITPDPKIKDDLIQAITGFPLSEWKEREADLTDILEKVRSEVENVKSKLDADVVKGELTLFEKNALENQLKLLLEIREKYGKLIERIKEGTKTDDPLIIGSLIGSQTDYAAFSKEIETLTEDFQNLAKALGLIPQGATKSQQFLEGIKAQIIEMRETFAFIGKAEYFDSISDGIEDWYVKFDSIKKVISDIIFAMESVKEIMGSVGDIINSMYDARIAKIEEVYNIEKENIEKTKLNEAAKSKKLLDLEEDKNSRIAALKTRQAKWDKALAVFNAFLGWQVGVASSIKDGPLATLVAGVAGQLAFGAALATPIPKYAKGGIFYGRQLAEVGEYRNVRHNPEVISPLSELKKLMGGSEVFVHGEIDGYKLAIVQQNSAQRYKRL